MMVYNNADKENEALGRVDLHSRVKVRHYATPAPNQKERTRKTLIIKGGQC